MTGARIGADIGGTFTDVVLESGAERYAAKILTTYDAPERALLAGVRQLLGQAGIGPGDVELFIHGTTLATNALIERRGARTGFVTTAGFRDVLEMGTESRFDQYDIGMQKPPPLVPRHLRFTVPERLAADGSVKIPLDLASLAKVAEQLRVAEVASVAIGFMHSYQNPRHEEQAAEFLAACLTGVPISLSSQVSPEMREYERFSTTVANAYVQPVMADYLRRLDQALAAGGFCCPLYLMLSSGGITTVDIAIRFPVRLVESGPAGGAIFAAQIGRRMAADQILAFDMGGTTAKICFIDDGKPHTSHSFEVARTHRFRKGSGLPLRIPVVEMVEIGAGGGSIAAVDRVGRLAVGPHSAGSEPGPACYGRGGTEPTVTDADLVLGKIEPLGFAGGQFPLDRGQAEVALAGLGRQETAAAWALAVCEIVDEMMASAARVHGVEQGLAVERRTMVAFGGAAPLHAARLALKLGIARVVVPPAEGVGSAVGFLRAPIAYEISQSHYVRLEFDDLAKVNALLDRITAAARAVVGRGAPDAVLEERRLAFARYCGQGHELAIELPARDLCADDQAMLRTIFETAYQTQYGRILPGLPIEILTWRVRVAAPGGGAIETPAAVNPRRIEATEFRPVHDTKSDRLLPHAVFDRASLRPGDRFTGPAVIVEAATSTLVTPEFEVSIDAFGSIVMERAA